LKKQLMTTTALAAAGILAATGAIAAEKAKKPTLSLGGWGEGIVVIADQDSTVTKAVGVDVQHEAEIHFKGSATLDNGIKLATRVELEGNVSAGDQIDEAYVTVSGSFGQIRIGADDNAASSTGTGFGTGGTQVANHTIKDSNDVATRPSGHNAALNMQEPSFTGDAEKITYFTPRIGGFQLGLSWEPSEQEDANNSLSPTSSRHDGFSVSAEFSQKFGGVGLGLYAGYSNIAGGSSDLEDNHPQAAAFGARVDFGGFRLSGLYGKKWNNGTGNGAGTSGNTQEVIDLGARYKAGANHFSIGYVYGEDDGDTRNGATDDTQIVLASYRRDLGPGVQYRLNLWWVDYTGENVGSTDDGETFALSTSVRVAF
jgi:outer membrane protein OmpU